MAAKAKTSYRCSVCDYETPRWMGKCPSCGQWDTLAEEVRPAQTKQSSAARRTGDAVRSMALSEISRESEHRYHTGIGELDRVLGGGIVKGSLVLLGGDPGIGKSTLLLQICEYIGRSHRILYVSGEESLRQIKLRADRLGVTSENLSILNQTDTEVVCEYIQSEKPDLVIIDSIQTMNLEQITSAPGSVVQVRESANFLMRTAKTLDIPVFLVGHVNKDGAIAGPKVLEHIVDAVLHFEGERNLSYRILRAVKNRYGSTNEIGVFEMGDAGLREVSNPSVMLLEGRPLNVPGTCVACMMEGTRPILAEVQGLVAASGFGNPRRVTNGFDYNRLNMLLAVLEKRAGFFFGTLDAYVNVVGGLRLDEPAADLTVALALVSSLKDVPVGEDLIVFGEIGLAGELRAVSHCEARIMEAKRLGFTKCILPASNLKQLRRPEGMELIGAKSVRAAFDYALNAQS